MLYAGTTTDLPLNADADIRVEEIEQHRLAVRRWFSSPFVHFVGAHTGCSCGFPHVIAESPIEYFDGMFEESEQRTADLGSIRLLIDLVDRSLKGGALVELYAVWDGHEAEQPKGVIQLTLDSLDPDHFFFVERFMHLVRSGSLAARHLEV